MGVRPPSNGVGDEPKTIEFGIAALDAHIDEQEETFPVTSDELSARYEDLRISVDAAGHEIAFVDALERCEQSEFENRQDLFNALHAVFEAERERRGGTIVGRLRSLVPF